MTELGTFTIVGEGGEITLDALVGSVPGVSEVITTANPSIPIIAVQICECPRAEDLNDADHGKVWLVDGKYQVYCRDIGGFRSLDADPGP